MCSNFGQQNSLTSLSTFFLDKFWYLNGQFFYIFNNLCQFCAKFANFNNFCNYSAYADAAADDDDDDDDEDTGEDDDDNDDDDDDEILH